MNSGIGKIITQSFTANSIETKMPVQRACVCNRGGNNGTLCYCNDRQVILVRNCPPPPPRAMVMVTVTTFGHGVSNYSSGNNNGLHRPSYDRTGNLLTQGAGYGSSGNYAKYQ